MIKAKVENKEEVIVKEVAPEKVMEAVVYNGKYEIRRYSLSIHGEDYVKLAEDFASKKNYTVRMEEAKVGVKCPACGHLFHL